MTVAAWEGDILFGALKGMVGFCEGAGDKNLPPPVYHTLEVFRTVTPMRHADILLILS